jgi:hypothetical protein
MISPKYIQQKELLKNMSPIVIPAKAENIGNSPKIEPLPSVTKKL